MKIQLDNYEKKYLLIIGIMTIILPLIFTRDWNLVSFKDTGEIGDTIGGVTAPFTSLFGSLLVYLALKAQIDANKLVQDQFKKQEEDDLRKSFENTFFNIINLHLKLVNSIELTKNIPKGGGSLTRSKQVSYVTNVFKGADVFENKYELLKVYMSALIDQDSNKIQTQFKDVIISSNLLESLDEVYNKGIYPLVYNDFGNYFRSLYRIIKMIDQQEFFLRPQKENNSKYQEQMNEIVSKEFGLKYYYTSIIRAYLSDFEVKWLFFNGLSNKGEKKFKPLIEKYTLLKILNENEEKEIKEFKAFYNIKAFVK